MGLTQAARKMYTMDGELITDMSQLLQPYYPQLCMPIQQSASVKKVRGGFNSHLILALSIIFHLSIVASRQEIPLLYRVYFILGEVNSTTGPEMRGARSSASASTLASKILLARVFERLAD